MALLEVDRAGIELGIHSERMAGRASVSLLVTMPGADPRKLAHMVHHTLRGLGAGLRTYPTSHGTYVYLRDSSEWLGAVDALSSSINRDTLSDESTVTVTRPRRTHDWWTAMREDQRPRPAAFLGFRLAPPFHERERAASGETYAGWGVAEDVTEELIEHAAHWLSACGGEGAVFDGPRDIAVLSDDAVGVMHRMIRDCHLGFDASFPGPTLGDGGRHVSLGYWGQVAHVTAGTGLDNVVVAQEMMDILRRFAEHLDVGAVRPGVAGITRNFAYDSRRWLDNRLLWATHAQLPNAIQLLTSAHLERAHDLDSWIVEEIADDRWIVRAKDLTPWFDNAVSVDGSDAQTVPVKLIQSAIKDFGDMLLTPEAAAAHPLPSSPTSP